MQVMKIAHLYADKNGESHFAEKDIAFELNDFSPPTLPVGVSDAQTSRTHLFLRLPPHWFGKFHTAPSRQIVTVVQGEVEVTVSDGVSRLFAPGATMLAEDTIGKGHATRNMSDEPVVLSVTQL